MKYTIPKYSEDRSLNIGKKNILNLIADKGKLYFTGAYIFLAPICNFRCKGCFTHVYKNNSAQLSFNSIKKIVDFAKNRGAKSIIFAGAGEPTLDPLYEKVRNYINKLGLQVVLFTNGTTITSKKEAKEMLISGPVVAKMFSLDAKKYNELTGCKNAFAMSMKGINFLIQARNELEKSGKKVSLAIDSYVSRKNYKDLPDLLKFCRKNRIIPYFESFIELGQPKNIIKQMALCEKELANLFLQLARIDKEKFKINTEIKPWSRNYGQDVCKKATHMFCVRENGDVYMCVCSLRKVGNIYQNKNVGKSLENIFDVKNKKLLNYLKCDKCSKMVNPKFLKLK